jgi:hypothetical protein
MSAFVGVGKRAGVVEPKIDPRDIVGAEAKAAKERLKETVPIDKTKVTGRPGYTRSKSGFGLRSLLGSGGFQGFGGSQSFFKQGQWKPK